MVSYAPDEMVYSYSATGPVKAVFSEVYYPAGWSAVLEDGTVLEIGLADELLRSAELPAGEHEITMRFEPRSYVTGERVSRASSILLLLILLGSALASLFLKKDN